MIHQCGQEGFVDVVVATILEVLLQPLNVADGLQDDLQLRGVVLGGKVGNVALESPEIGLPDRLLRVDRVDLK